VTGHGRFESRAARSQRQGDGSDPRTSLLGNAPIVHTGLVLNRGHQELRGAVCIEEARTTTSNLRRHLRRARRRGGRALLGVGVRSCHESDRDVIARCSR
jgi:hypothetical protein